MGKQVIFKNKKGLKLIGVLDIPNKKRFPLVILCHGLRSSKNSEGIILIAKKLFDFGIGTFRFDFTNHGDSEKGQITIAQWIDDLQSALDYVKKLKDIDADRIGLEGSSFSGVVTLVIASTNNIKLICLKSPVVNYIELNNEGRIARDAVKHNGYEYAKKVKCPCLIVHGDKDESVPLEQSERLVKILDNGKLKVIKNANHSYEGYSFDEMVKVISSWFIENL